MSSAEQHRPELWHKTPLIYSRPLSNSLNCEVYLKLENLQPSHSFKCRGISSYIYECKKKNGADMHAVIASGGNAGLAAAHAASILRVRCSVFIPEAADQKTMEFLRLLGADVVIGGKHYSDALKKAEEVARKDDRAVMVPAYDDPIIWQGHSSMIEEVKEQLCRKPDAIFCSVGGGGLLGGLIVGARAVGWDDVPIIAAETMGSDCFYYSALLNRDLGTDRVIHLPPGSQPLYDAEHNISYIRLGQLTSRASGSLGAAAPARAVVKMALQRAGGVKCVRLPDELSVLAAVRFADDHKFLVELACATTLAAGYYPALFERLVGKTRPPGIVVFVVCGGYKTFLEETTEFRAIAEGELENGRDWVAEIDGDSFAFEK